MLYPLKFVPRYKERIWGGRAIEKVLDQALPAGKKIGESWEISGVQGNVSVVANGQLAGNNLQELIEVYMGDLVGEKVYEKYGDEFPVLVKILDTQEDLSIQVHPNDTLARQRHNAYGKNELMYIIEAEAGAVIYVGFKKQVTREQYLEAVKNETLLELLNRFEVKPGDAYYVPAGTIHAIGKGVLIAEIQQTSDITYRIYDWNRIGYDGNPRQLHTDLAADAIDFGPPKNYNVTKAPIVNEPVTLVDTEYFTVNLLKVRDCMEREYTNMESFVIYVCIEGEMSVGSSDGIGRIVKGETVLVPAEEDIIELDGDGLLLAVFIK